MAIGSAGEMQLTDEAYWLALESLWERATGGSDVAAKPATDTTDVLPLAARPAGVSEAADWFRTGLENADVPRFLFLVGGPGAGKSHAAIELVSHLAVVNDIDDGLAHRSYSYTAGTRRVLLVNDASIGLNEGNVGRPLMGEIQESIDGGSHLVACVNRGVLVEEHTTSGIVSTRPATASDTVLNWLVGAQGQSSDSDFEIRERCDESYLKVAELVHGERVAAHVVAVFVDVCSLTEERPSSSIDLSVKDEFVVSADAYSIRAFAERASLWSETTPAGDLLQKVIEMVALTKVEGDAAPDPFWANVESLKSIDVRSGLLSIVRGAEIASGVKMTFREIWGTVVRCIVADRPGQLSRGKVREWLERNRPTQSQTVERQFISWRTLADQRFAQTIFGVNSDPRSNAVTRVLTTVDPMMDALLGTASSAIRSGWFTPLANAFSGPITEESPLSSLARELDGDDVFWSAVTDFDRDLDIAFVRVMRQSLTDAVRYETISWYGRYLGRLYAVSNGIPAFQDEINLWTVSWSLSPTIPKDLTSGLRTLLRPKRRPSDTDATSLIPVFDSRTDPIVGEDQPPKVALATGDVEMKTSTDGESLFLKLFQDSKELALMPFDFALVRESLACSSERPGVTELTGAISPRLERFRAARLAPVQLRNADYRIVSGAEEFNLAVSMGSK